MILLCLCWWCVRRERSLLWETPWNLRTTVSSLTVAWCCSTNSRHHRFQSTIRETLQLEHEEVLQVWTSFTTSRMTFSMLVSWSWFRCLSHCEIACRCLSGKPWLGAFGWSIIVMCFLLDPGRRCCFQVFFPSGTPVDKVPLNCYLVWVGGLGVSYKPYQPS